MENQELKKYFEDLKKGVKKAKNKSEKLDKEDDTRIFVQGSEVQYLDIQLSRLQFKLIELKEICRMELDFLENETEHLEFQNKKIKNKEISITIKNLRERIKLFEEILK